MKSRSSEPSPWACRIIVRQQHPRARSVATRDGMTIRLEPDGSVFATGRSRDEAWSAAWRKLQETQDA